MTKTNGILVALILVTGLVFIVTSPSFFKSATPEPVACTQEAKICPDGSSVGRVGPRCEFAACPTMVAVTSPTATPVLSPEPASQGDMILAIGQTAKIGNVRISLNSLASDSRCPTDVTCIWAGAVTVEATVTDGTNSVTRNFTTGEATYTFGTSHIAITEVLPPRENNKEILGSEYRVTFHIVTDVLPPATETLVNGRVTLSPICPVERMPPDPSCAPRAYETNIAIFRSADNALIKTIRSGNNGAFSTTLPLGSYILRASGGTTYPRCDDVTIAVKTKDTISTNISCDTGIR